MNAAQWFLIIAGVLEVAIGIIGWVGEALNTANPSAWCSNAIQGSSWRIFSALGVGAIVLGLQSIVAGIFGAEAIARRFRGLRWFAHWIFFWFVFQVLVTLRLSDPYLRWWLPILASGGLALAQAINESSNQEAASQVMTGTFWDSVPRIEAWLAALGVIVSFWVVFFITPLPTGGALAFWLLVLIWYVLFHVYILFVTNIESTRNQISDVAREVIFVVFEVVLVGVAYGLVFGLGDLSVCVP
jgi:hypothetical protein